MDGLRPRLDADGHLQPVPAALDYGIPVEPYLFVVDAQGDVFAKFEGIVGGDELRAASRTSWRPADAPGAADPRVRAAAAPARALRQAPGSLAQAAPVAAARERRAHQLARVADPVPGAPGRELEGQPTRAGVGSARAAVARPTALAPAAR